MELVLYFYQKSSIYKYTLIGTAQTQKKSTKTGRNPQFSSTLKSQRRHFGRSLRNPFRDKWDNKYPTIGDIWQRNWQGIIPFLSFPDDIRKAIYTTNAIEAINRQIRKIIKSKGCFPSDEAVFKLVFLALQNATKKWTMPIREWKMALNQFSILF